MHKPLVSIRWLALLALLQLLRLVMVLYAILIPGGGDPRFGG